MLALLVLPLVPVFAVTITVEVGDNFYRASDKSTIVRMSTNDELVFRNVGSSTHPTVSSSTPAAWAPFVISPSSPSKNFPPLTFAPGTYPFFCSAHGGQTGTLVVTGTATATLDAHTAGIALNVFPNPSRGQITVQLNQKTGVAYKLRLSNIIGQEVRTIALKPELTSAGLPLDLSDLPTGMYFYSLLADGKVTATKRLVLQN